MIRTILKYSVLFSITAVMGCDIISDTQSNLDGPTHAIVGSDNNVYVSDGYYNSRIAVFDTSGNYLRSWGSKGYGSSQFNNPHGIGFMSDGTLLVCDRDNNRIQRFDKNGTFISQWHSQEMSRPWNITITKHDTIFVADGGDQDNQPKSGIVAIDKDGNFLARIASFGSALGQFDQTHSMTLSENNNIYAVDLKNERVQKLKRSGSSQLDYQVDSVWTANASQFISKPVAVEYHKGIIYISQEGKTIRMLDPVSGNLLGDLGNRSYNKIHSISFDKFDHAWIVDVNKNKVMRLNRQGEIVLEIGGEQ